MPTINLEMMKQLLEEFSEKEALTTEEINVIGKEIVSLEQRVGICRNKLQNLGADKEKLTAMKERYISGKFPPPIRAPLPITAQESNIHSNGVAGISEPLPTPDSIGSIDTSGLTHNPQTGPEESTAKSEPEVQANTANPVNQPEYVQIEEESAKTSKESDHNKEGSEPIKSINDALKGLFRK